MSSEYNANGSTPTQVAFAPIAIASSTNASPIEITTSSPHGLNGTVYVQVTGHQTNTAANGSWMAVVTGASTLTLSGSTGNGVGGATGQVQVYSVDPIQTLPGDGDLANAASVNGPNENAADFQPWTNQRLGKYNLHDVYQAGDFTALNTLYSTTAPTVSTWTVLTSLSNLLSSLDDRYMVSGDIIEVSASFTFRVINTATDQYDGLAIGVSYDGGAYSPVSSSVRTIYETSGIGFITLLLPVQLQCTIAAAPTSRFDLAIMGYRSASGHTLDVYSGYSLIAKHYRSNG